MDLKHSLLAVVILIVIASCSSIRQIGWRKLPLDERFKTKKSDKPIHVNQKALLTGFKKQILHYNNVILLAGKVNIGKSSLATFLTRQNLKSVEKGGKFQLQDDHKRISEVHPYTIYPGLFLDEKYKLAYYDLPGYNIVNDASFETISKFFTYKLLSFVRYVKIITVFKWDNFLTPQNIIKEIYDMIRSFLNRHKLKHYYTSTMLALTFVEDDGPSATLRPDSIIKEEVKNRLNEAHRLADSVIPQGDEIKDEVKRLIKHFSDNYQKMALFRVVQGSGSVYNLPTHSYSNAMQVTDNVETVKLLHASKLDYSIINYHFRGTHRELRIYVNGAREEVNKGIALITSTVKKYFSDMVENSKDHKKTVGIFEDWIKIYEQILDEIAYFCKNTRNACVDKIFEKVGDLDIELPKNLQFKINCNFKYVVFAEMISKSKYFAFNTNRWVDKLKTVLTYLKMSKDFLANLIKHYKKNSKLVYDKINEERIKSNTPPSCCGNFVLKKPDRPKMEILRSINTGNTLPTKETEVGVHEIDSGHGNNAKGTGKSLREIKTNVECYITDYSTAVIRVKGNFLNFINLLNNKEQSEQSETIHKNYKTFCCKDPSGCDNPYTIERVEFFTLDSIELNVDFRKIFSENFDFPVEVAIVSPKWKVKGNVNINLNGNKGDDGYKGNLDGKPGGPGKPAKAFLGIGENFIDTHTLTITTKGGEGGKGENGLMGYPGRSGKDRFNDYPFKCPEDKQRESLTAWHGRRCELGIQTLVRVITAIIGPFVLLLNIICLEGIPGLPGGSGGHGGRGGHGGYGNEVKIISMIGSKHSISTYGGVGKNGTNGTGGSGGLGGLNECDFVVNRFIFLFDVRFGYLCKNPETNRAPSGKDGKDGYNAEDIQPAKKSNPILYSHGIINGYKNFLLENLVISEKMTDYVKFYNSLDKNQEVEELYTALGFIQNFIVLERHFLKFKKFDEYLGFYKSLRDRINSFDLNKVNLYEARSVNVSLDGFPPLTEEDKKTAIENNKIAINILNSTVLSKIYSLEYGRRELHIQFDLIPKFNALIEEIIEYKNLTEVLRQREEAKFVIDGLRRNRDALQAQMDVQRRAFIDAMKMLKGNMLSLKEEVDEKIEEVEENMRKQVLAMIIKTILGIISFIVGLFPVIGQFAKAVVCGAAIAASAITDAVLPPTVTELPEGVTDGIEKTLDNNDLWTPAKVDEISTAMSAMKKEIGNQCPDCYKNISELETHLEQGKKENMIPTDIKKLPGYLQQLVKDYYKQHNVQEAAVDTIYNWLKSKNFVGGLDKKDFERLFNLPMSALINRKDIPNLVGKLLDSDAAKFLRNSAVTAISKVLNFRAGAIKSFYKIAQAAKNFFGKTFGGIFGKMKELFEKMIGPIFDIVMKVTQSNVAVIKQEEKNLAKLIDFKYSIQEKVIPILDDFTNKVDREDFMKIDVEKLNQMNLPSQFAAIRNKLENMGKGFKLESTITLTLNMVQTTLDKITDLIIKANANKDVLKQLEAVAVVLSDAKADNITNNIPLRESIDDLKRARFKNEIVINYAQVIASMQFVFFPEKNPFNVTTYEAGFMTNRSEFNAYADRALSSIQQIRDSYQPHATLNLSFPVRYFSNDFSDPDTLPFFSWHRRNPTYLEQIKDLLLGKRVFFNADIRFTAHQFHAVKFREIAIEFTLKYDYTPEEKVEFNKAIDKISDCIVTLTMLGDTRYRCGDKIIKVKSKMHNFTHSYNKFKQTASTVFEREYVHENSEYSELKKFPHQLSPYSDWYFHIKCEDDSHLKKLINLVDLHLVGSAAYKNFDDCTYK